MPIWRGNPIARNFTRVPCWPLKPQHGDPSERTFCSGNNDLTIVALRRLTKRLPDVYLKPLRSLDKLNLNTLRLKSKVGHLVLPRFVLQGAPAIGHL